MEPLQPTVPLPTNLSCPLYDTIEMISSRSEADLPAQLGTVDQTSVAEYRQMLGHGLPADREISRQLGSGHRHARCETFEDRQSSRVGQGSKHLWKSRIHRSPPNIG